MFTELDEIAREIVAIERKLKGTKVWNAYQLALSKFEKGKKVFYPQYIASNWRGKHVGAHSTTFWVDSKVLDKEALEAFLSAHGKSLADFETPGGYIKTILHK